MKAPQQIDLDESATWTGQDLEKLKAIFEIETIDDIIYLWETNQIVRIADTDDYEYAYEDYLRDENELNVTLDEFKAELKKGYGKSKYLPIARLIELSNGIYYDNEYS